MASSKHRKNRLVPVVHAEGFPSVVGIGGTPAAEMEGKVDMVFIDPPYNIGVDYGGADDSKSDEDYKRFTLSYLETCHCMLRPGGSLFLLLNPRWAAFAGGHLHDAAKRWTFVNEIIWHYRFGMYNDRSFIGTHANLLYFVKVPYEQRTWRVRPVLEPSLRKSLYGDKRVSESPRKGERPLGDVWFGEHLSRVQGGNRERRTTEQGALADHPNQVPEILVARCIRSTTAPGDLVVDLFTGSGTTGTVAHALGRRFAGWEINPKFAKSALDRILKGPARDVGGSLVAATKGYAEAT